MVPEKEFLNLEAMTTIADNPDLFEVVTPINVDRLEELLVNFPNQPFAKSVCQSVRSGFWPFLDTMYGDYPTTLDSSDTNTTSPELLDFIAAQIEIEVDA